MQASKQVTYLDASINFSLSWFRRAQTEITTTATMVQVMEADYSIDNQSVLPIVC